MELCVVSLIMLLCGLEGSGFIIAVGLTLLMAGVIIYYVNARIRDIQAAVEKQGNVLSQLITDVRSHVGGSMSLATPEAKAAAMEFVSNQEGRSELIPVSDDDDDSEDTDDYDSSSDDENASTIAPISLNEPNPASGVEISVNELSGLRVIEADINSAVVPEGAKLSPDDDSMSDGDDSSDGSDNEDFGETLNPSTMTVSKIDGETIELNQDSSDIGESTIKGMRVNQLRDLAMHRKQVPESEAKSMKKPELLQLLLAQ